MKLKNNSKRSIFISILMSYIFFFGIIISLTAFGYFYSAVSIRNENINSRINLLEKAKNTIDTNIQSVYEVNEMLSLNRLLTKNAGYGVRCTPEELVDVKSLQSLLQSTDLYQKGWDSINVYYPKSNSIISSNTRRFSGEDFSLFTQIYGLSENEFMDLISTDHYWDYSIFEIEGEEPKIIFLRNVYGSSPNTKIAVIFTVVSTSKMFSELQDIFPKESGCLFVANESNFLLKSSDEEQTDYQLLCGSLTQEGKVNYVKIDGINYANTFVYSNAFDWKYGLSMKENQFLGGLQIFKWIIIIELALCLIIGLVLTYILSRRTYNPISNIINILQKNSKTASNSNNYKSIENAITSLMNENSLLNNRIQNEQSVRINSLLSNILKGRIRERALIEGLLLKKNINANPKNFLVALFSPENTNESVFNINQEFISEEAFTLQFFVIKNVIDETIYSKYPGISVEVDDMVACIITLPDDVLQEDIKPFLADIIEFHKKNFRLDLKVSMSLLHTDIAGLSDAYSEALEALSYQHFWGKDVHNIQENSCGVVGYNEIVVSVENTDTKYFLEQIKKLVNYLESCDYTMAYRHMDEIYETSFPKDIKYLQFNKYRMSCLIGLLLVSLGTLTDDDKKLHDSINYNERLFKIKSLKELKQVTKLIFDEIIQYNKEKMKNDIPLWIKEVKVYISKHYLDNNLSVAMIADAFNISVPHLSRTFKLYTNEGVLECIHKERLEVGRRLLLENNSVKNVAEKTGYIDTKAFIRAFKRYEGITPQQFKDMQTIK